MFRFIWYYASEYIFTLSILALIFIAFTVKSCEQRIPDISKVDRLLNRSHFELQIRQYHGGIISSNSPNRINSIQVDQSTTPIIYYNGAQAPFTKQAKQNLKALLEACIQQHKARNVGAYGCMDSDTDYRFITAGKDFVLKPENCAFCSELAQKLPCSLEFKLPKDQKLQAIYCDAFSED